MVDEGHRLKNASCCLSTKLRTFKAEGRLLLTGGALVTMLMSQQLRRVE